ncbi:MAG: alanine--tRNA ligase [Prolixibacteraceae bacterium]|nr:alanine--tRNA ligase [Prolixibacteraceae bacterium]
MNSKSIRKAFLDFFVSKKHMVVPSSPMVVKNDPTLMFTNAGMNQFKDIFLGNQSPKHTRFTDTQKCLRVSGKHNDLEEVGRDTYHHTMFEMLGNWSFGDYFKKEAIDWAWEFLHDKMGISEDRLYATIFEGSKEDKLSLDDEARSYWLKHLPAERIIPGNKKDNFWEMGDTGPCGPCSEIHIDLRSDAERDQLDGRELVNKDHPLVIEIWNLVFMQYNRMADGHLEDLPARNVDTGMGFERLCMVLEGKKSNYDTDVFQPIILGLGNMCGKKYGENKDTDIAMRVISDHLRAISFAIADGQLPSNNKAGYVIRRILRRAERYGYTFLGFRKAFMYKLVDILVKEMGDSFPEIKAQQDLIEKVMKEEEDNFLHTLETGIHLLEEVADKVKKAGKKEVEGKVAFVLYDTYGFPLDLTELILKEQNLSVNSKEFEEEMKKQKNRSKNAASQETGDWMEMRPSDEEKFIGYQSLISDVNITRYRKVNQKNKIFYQLVFDQTPFYGEMGGQVGDTGYLEADGEKILITNTIKENNLIIHIAKKLPVNPKAVFHAVVNSKRRILIADNHSATHLLDQALREILGNHIEQKGSYVCPDYLRFDFSHFRKVTDEELSRVQKRVNELIRMNIKKEEIVDVPINKAKEYGAIALFGEKYGDKVRIIRFGESVELCGGTHIASTGQIGCFVILSEGAVSAGVRRIEAITADKAEEYLTKKTDDMKEIGLMMNNTRDIKKSVSLLMEENSSLKKQVEKYERVAVSTLKDELKNKVVIINGVNVLAEKIIINSTQTMKDLAFQLRGELEPLFCVMGAEINGKPSLNVIISESLVKEKGLNAGNIIREAAKEMNGKGGGQPFYAMAGGNDVKGIPAAIEKAVLFFKK